MKRWLNESVASVLEFVNLVLQGRAQVPPEVCTESLSVAKHWCVYSKKSFFANEQFVSTIFQLIQCDNVSMDLFKKVVNTLKKMLGTSEWSKLMVNVRFERAVKPDAIPIREM